MSDRTTHILAVTVLNILWVGFFCVMIFSRGWSGWTLVVPILFHWSLKTKDDDDD